MIRKAIFLKHTYPDEVNMQVSCTVASLPVLNARPVRSYLNLLGLGKRGGLLAYQ